MPAPFHAPQLPRTDLEDRRDGHADRCPGAHCLEHALECRLRRLGRKRRGQAEFELIRPRWYWFNEKIASHRQQYRLSYNALARQYRVALGKLYQNFGSLAEALALLNRVRLRDVAAPAELARGTTYIAALRMRLDTSQLPRPFQISAVGSRDWSLSSDWHRWSFEP